MRWCGGRPALIIDAACGFMRWAMRGANGRALALLSTLALAACGATLKERMGTPP